MTAASNQPDVTNGPMWQVGYRSARQLGKSQTRNLSSHFSRLFPTQLTHPPRRQTSSVPLVRCNAAECVNGLVYGYSISKALSCPCRKPFERSWVGFAAWNTSAGISKVVVDTPRPQLEAWAALETSLIGRSCVVGWSKRFALLVSPRSSREYLICSSTEDPHPAPPSTRSNVGRRERPGRASASYYPTSATISSDTSRAVVAQQNDTPLTLVL
ncbi:hypothetical protein LX36DRAFT_466404 [Colletotrichum falcatum]|nr:hypothetical protein LX36DRAFT_466404 [Colletotrichum falcatum]